MMFQRVANSWSIAWYDYEQRISLGIQPKLPGANLITMVIGNALYLVISLVLYLVMKKQKEGFQLKRLMIWYNIVCVLLAGYVVVGILLFKLENKGSFACNDLLTNGAGQDMAFIFWVFYVQKYWEFLDTFLYILRKSFRQVTFLHLFHHSSIIFVVGTVIRFGTHLETLHQKCL